MNSRQRANRLIFLKVLKERHHIEPRQVIAERYCIKARLGSGGMGEVFLAEQLELAREVALKLLKPSLSHMPGARARFKREARVAAAFHHPGAVEIYDFGEAEEQLFIAMELLRGPTVWQVLSETSQQLVPQQRVLAIARDVVEVLVAAQAIGLVHRDLKPSNIFLVCAEDRVERAVVADFGLAFIANRDDTGRLTQEGVLSGTPAYISPEQALGRKLTAAADIYSFGCTLYEMLTGHQPFHGESEVAIITKHLFSFPEKPSRVRGDSSIAHSLDELILEMLRKRPEERPTPRTVLARLNRILESLDSTERSRGERMLLPRQERMIDEPIEKLSDPTLLVPSPKSHVIPETMTTIWTHGSLEEALLRGLAANGFVCEPLSSQKPGSEVRALFVPGATIAELEQFCLLDLPIVTDTNASDMERISRTLELGIDEVLPRPVRVEELSRRLTRAIRRYRSRDQRNPSGGRE